MEVAKLLVMNYVKKNLSIRGVINHSSLPSNVEINKQVAKIINEIASVEIWIANYAVCTYYQKVGI